MFFKQNRQDLAYSDKYLVYTSQKHKSEIPLVLIPEVSLPARNLWTSNHKLTFSWNVIIKRISPISLPLATKEALSKLWYITCLNKETVVYKSMSAFVFKWIKRLGEPIFLSGGFLFSKERPLSPVSQKGRANTLFPDMVYFISWS